MLALGDCRALTRKCKIHCCLLFVPAYQSLHAWPAVLALQLCKLVQQLWQLHTKLTNFLCGHALGTSCCVKSMTLTFWQHQVMSS